MSMAYVARATKIIAAVVRRAGEVAKAAGVESYHGTMQRCAGYPKLWQHELTTVSDALACATSRQYERN